jgi:hypothetical protein
MALVVIIRLDGEYLKNVYLEFFLRYSFQQRYQPPFHEQHS